MGCPESFRSEFAPAFEIVLMQSIAPAHRDTQKLGTVNEEATAILPF